MRGRHAGDHATPSHHRTSIVWSPTPDPIHAGGSLGPSWTEPVQSFTTDDLCIMTGLCALFSSDSWIFARTPDRPPHFTAPPLHECHGSHPSNTSSDGGLECDGTGREMKKCNFDQVHPLNPHGWLVLVVLSWSIPPLTRFRCHFPAPGGGEEILSGADDEDEDEDEDGVRFRSLVTELGWGKRSCHPGGTNAESVHPPRTD